METRDRELSRENVWQGGRTCGAGDVGLTEKTCSNTTDHKGEARLAGRETKDSMLAVNYRRGCHGSRNSQSNRREFVGKSGQSRVSKRHRSLSDPSPTNNATMQQRGLPHSGEYLGLCPLTT